MSTQLLSIRTKGRFVKALVLVFLFFSPFLFDTAHTKILVKNVYFSLYSVHLNPLSRALWSVVWECSAAMV